MNRILITFALISLWTISADAQPMPPLTLQKTIPLPGVTGRFDHLAIDTAGNRLFIAAPGNHSVEVVELTTNKIKQSITGLGKPHGLAWVAATGSLYVADGALGELRLYKGTPLALAGKIKLSDDADDMVYDDATHMLFVGHGGSDAANPAKVAVVDTANFSLVANLSVATHPEALDIDPQNRRVFANIAEASEVAVIGTATRSIDAHWKLTKAAGNVPMAFDREHQLLFVACRTPGMLLALDASTGKEVASLPTADGADDLFYDTVLRRVYVISGAGEVDSYQVEGARLLRPLGVLQTAAGAKTALFVPGQSQLYVGVPGVGGKLAEIRVYKTPTGQTPDTGALKSAVETNGELEFVAIVSRHGVRSPTGKTDQLNQYSAEPWPTVERSSGLPDRAWRPPDDAVRRLRPRAAGSAGTACAGRMRRCGSDRIVADSDQRTRETGKALAAGLAPGCTIELSAFPEGTPTRSFIHWAPEWGTWISCWPRPRSPAASAQTHRDWPRHTARNSKRLKRCCADAILDANCPPAGRSARSVHLRDFLVDCARKGRPSG